MAATKRTSGLSIGQILTLTLGFLVASVLIFIFGIWVGKDIVERRLAQEERIVRKTVDQTAVEIKAAPALQLPTEPQPTPSVAIRPSKPPTVQVVAATATPTKLAPRPTRRTPREIALPPVGESPTLRTPVSVGEWADSGWTVQVYATTDPKQATAMARRLIAKGYQAYTLEAPMRGVTWYRVRVGRFTSRERAKMMERRLKQLEGMEAAYVTPR